MDETILIKLLQLHYQHRRNVGEFSGKMNLIYFEIDLLDLVLDAIGVPPDNTLKQIGKYGYGDWFDQPDTFSRYWHYREFEKRVRQGTIEECKSYLDDIVIAATFHPVPSGRNLEPVSMN